MTWIGIPARTLNYALTGAALLDLRLAYRIDTGATTLTVVDPMPLGDDLLDPVLAYLAQEITRSPSAAPEFWVRRLAGGADELRERVTAAPRGAGYPKRVCDKSPLPLGEG